MNAFDNIFRKTLDSKVIEQCLYNLEFDNTNTLFLALIRKQRICSKSGMEYKFQNILLQYGTCEIRLLSRLMFDVARTFYCLLRKNNVKNQTLFTYVKMKLVISDKQASENCFGNNFLQEKLLVIKENYRCRCSTTLLICNKLYYLQGCLQKIRINRHYKINFFQTTIYGNIEQIIVESLTILENDDNHIRLGSWTGVSIIKGFSTNKQQKLTIVLLNNR